VISPGTLTQLGSALGVAIIGLSLVLLTGYAGHASLATMTFAGLGAFAMARWGTGGSPLGLLAAIGIGVLAGGLVALPVILLRGRYMALSTMAFATRMDVLFFPNPHVFGNYGSASIDRLDLFGISLAGDRSYFVFLAFCFAALGVLVLAIRRSRYGLILSAVRDSQAGALSVGLRVQLAKLVVVAASSGLAAMGGALLTGLTSSAGAADFAMFQSLLVLLLLVVGGLTTISGALIGGLFFALFPYLQETLVPSLDGFVFLGTALAGIGVVRRPNGLAFDLAHSSQALAERLHAKLLRLRSDPAMERVAR
jgi:branched-chain amino acid transport system permease protein